MHQFSAANRKRTEELRQGGEVVHDAAGETETAGDAAQVASPEHCARVALPIRPELVDFGSVRAVVQDAQQDRQVVPLHGLELLCMHEQPTIAVLHARGQMKVGDRFVGISLIDTELHCRIDSELDIHGTPGFGTIISSRAWVIGTKQLRLDPADPFQTGYRLSDTWPQM